LRSLISPAARAWHLPALAAVGLALLVAGCGDDDDESTTTTTSTEAASITLDQWADQADQICAEGDRAQQQAAEQEFGEHAPSQDEFEEFATDVVVPGLQSQHDAIAELPAPEAEAEQVETMLAKLQEGIDQIAEDPAALVQGTDSIPGIIEATEIAQELGLRDCGSG